MASSPGEKESPSVFAVFKFIRSPSGAQFGAFDDRRASKIHVVAGIGQIEPPLSSPDANHDRTQNQPPLLHSKNQPPLFKNLARQPGTSRTPIFLTRCANPIRSPLIPSRKSHHPKKIPRARSPLADYVSQVVWHCVSDSRPRLLMAAN
jgi:hypothetical protein